MTISIICPHKDAEPWVAALREVDPSLDVQVWPNENNKADVEFALCWGHPEGVLNDYSNLRCICSMGAGIDHMLTDTLLPQHLPVIRLVDPMMAQSMFEYSLTAVMHYFREFDVYQHQKRQTQWQQQPPKTMAQTTVGIMGLGQLGQYSAEKFSNMGFKVAGWSRSKKTIEGVDTYAGEDQLEPFLAQTDILICLLPLTDQTHGILNTDLFNSLPKGACLINVARGEHLVEQDLITALKSGQLRGACLDVFQQEPLPDGHPFWQHPQLMLTPHCSSITDPRSVAPQIVENYRLMLSGGVLLNEVDIKRGY